MNGNFLDAHAALTSAALTWLPALVLGALRRRLDADGQVGDAERTLAVGGSDAVGTGVAPADHDDVAPLGGDLRPNVVARDDLVLLHEVVHREVHAEQIPAGDRQVAGHGGAGRDHDGVVARTQVVPGDVDTDGDARAEPRALGLHLREVGVVADVVADPGLHLYGWTVDETVLELPAGTRGWEEDWLVCAQRELREETGYQAERFISLGEVWAAPGVSDERMAQLLGLEAVDVRRARKASGQTAARPRRAAGAIVSGAAVAVGAGHERDAHAVEAQDHAARDLVATAAEHHSSKAG